MPPTILLIPGGWHPTPTFAPLATALRSHDLPVTPTQLASVDNRSPSSTVRDDTARLRQDLEPLLARGLHIVIVAHSYAGFPASAVLRDAAREKRREKGRRGGVVGAVYLAAFVPPEGVSLEAMVGGKVPEWQRPDERAGDIGLLDPVDTFYLDVDGAEAERCKALLRKQSLASFRSPAGDAGYLDRAYDGRRAYVLCEDDRAIPASAQRAMVEGSRVEWEVKVMKSSHSPFLSRTEETAEFVAGLAKRWERWVLARL